jgi:hypothetical protein
MAKPAIIDEWSGESNGMYTAVVQRTADGRWITGTKGSPGPYATDSMDCVTAVAAMRRLREMLGQVPPGALASFPPEMQADDYELPPEQPDAVELGGVTWHRVLADIAPRGLWTPRDGREYHTSAGAGWDDPVEPWMRVPDPHELNGYAYYRS